MGIERGEVRTDVDSALVTSILECTFERMQDFLLTSEPDRDLFHRTGNFSGSREQLIDQYITVLQSAIGTPRTA